MKRILVLLTSVGIAAACFAPIEDKPRGSQFYPEQSQEQLAGQQAYQGTVGQVGEVTMDERAKNSSTVGGDGQASKLLGEAGQAIGGRDVVARQAARLEQKAGGPGARWLWGGAFLALGLGAVVGLRAYANKAVPAGRKPLR